MNHGNHDMPYVREVHPPDNVEPAAWLDAGGYATGVGKPTVIPAGWPESRRLCLLVVYRDCDNLSHDCQTYAYLVTRPEAMHRLVNEDRSVQLWFAVPRHLFTPEVCPTLTAEDWPEEH